MSDQGHNVVQAPGQHPAGCDPAHSPSVHFRTQPVAPLARQLHDEHKARHALWEAQGRQLQEELAKPAKPKALPPPDPSIIAANAAIDAAIAEAKRRWDSIVLPPTNNRLRPHRTDQLRKIAAGVADAYRLSFDELVASHGSGRDRRRRGRATARHIARYLIREITGESWPRIGRLFNRDTSCPIHSWRWVKNRMNKDPAFAEKVWSIRSILQ